MYKGVAMSEISLIAPILKNNKISTFFKESYINATRTPFVRNLFERAPEKDVLQITSRYNRTPALYDDLFNGKIKIFLKGLSDKANPVFNENAIKPENFKSMVTSKTSLIGEIINLFDGLDKDQKTINKISIQLKDKRMHLMTFGFDHKAIDEFDIKVLDEKNPILNALKYSEDKRVDLYRD